MQNWTTYERASPTPQSRRTKSYARVLTCKVQKLQSRVLCLRVTKLTYLALRLEKQHAEDELRINGLQVWIVKDDGGSRCRNKCNRRHDKSGNSSV